MSKKTLEENLLALGIPDKVAFDALVELTPEVVPLKEEMVEVLESIDKTALLEFLDAPHPTDLANAFQRIRAD